MKKWIVGLLGLCVVFSAYAKKQPNVVLLLTDDQSYHLGMLGVAGLETPNIDALAKAGTFFSKAYSSLRLLRAVSRVDPNRHVSCRTGIYGGLYTGRIHMMTPDEIRAHVIDLFEKSGKGGGLTISSHDLDISTTDEQLEALVGTIKEGIY